jgi:hypothetical protein
VALVLTASGNPADMSDADISAPVAHTIGRPFQRGVSPNPGGRSKVARDIQALAQQHGPAAISTLAQALKSRNERVRVAAAAILLDRAYGKPVQAITTDPATASTMLHLLAARAVSNELVAALDQRERTINGHAEPSNGRSSPPVIDLSAPPPTE